MARDMNVLFSPASVAVYGASVEPGSMGNRAVANLVKGGFAGEIIPINPKYAGQEICGRRCYAGAADYGRDIDHAVMMIRASAVVPLIEDAIRGRVRSIAIASVDAIRATKQPSPRADGSTASSSKRRSPINRAGDSRPSSSGSRSIVRRVTR